MRFARVILAIIPFALACENGFVDPAGGVASAKMVVDGRGNVADRFTAELWVVGNIAYTTTWRARTTSTGTAPGNAIKIWDISGATPLLRDSVIVANATTLGDIQASDDGRLLIVATEPSPGSIVVFDISDPLHPQQVSRFTSANTNPGVHTAEVQRVNGKLYAFLSVDPSGADAARLVIVDLSTPSSPTEVFSQVMGQPFVHDVYVRDGILMAALWNDGVSIFDIGGGGKGGTVAAPALLGNVKIVGGKAHNIWWYHDSGGGKRYAIVGEEGPGSVTAGSSGDIHVVDVSNFANPVEVAFYSVAGAGTHNFSMDENRGILFAAYYNAGVKALDLRGDLGGCSAKLKSSDGRCDLAKMGREIGHGLSDEGLPVYVWGVQSVGSKVYASDMINGLWKLESVL
jgi:hypothetical protein